MITSLRIGDGPDGLSLMKFSLTYDGVLPTGGRHLVQDKWAIRKQIDPQLRELWRIHPTLAKAERVRFVPAKGGFMPVDQHHSNDPLVKQKKRKEDDIDLCAPIDRGGRSFWPLVRETYALICGLKIAFFRKESPGRVYQGGDLDNRIKTLLDALSIPTNEQVVADSDIQDPIYCLLEDDSMVASLEVDTKRLLTRPDAGEHEVRLIIDVDVRVQQARTYNTLFLGD